MSDDARARDGRATVERRRREPRANADDALESAAATDSSTL